MKKIMVLAFALLFLTGCSQPVWETVNDTLDAPVGSWMEESYQIDISLPHSMKLLEEREGWKIYTTDDGTMEVETRTFLASNLDTAVQTLTGYRASQLNILQTERFDLPEYQFAWVTQTECGERLCRADLVIDDLECYAVVCSSLADAGNEHASHIRQVISTFGLYTDEGV